MTLRMSALPRAAACPGSLVLPQANTQTVWSEAGTSRHEIADAAIKGDSLEQLPPEIRDLIPIGALVGSEVSIAYDWRADTARLPNSPLRETEISGTIDLLIHDGSTGRLTVVDYKGHDDVGSPSENEQIMGYALAAARAYAASAVTVIVAYVEESGGALRLIRQLVVREVDELDLDAFAGRLRGIVRAVEAQRVRKVPDVAESKHCRWCPAAAACPAKVALIKRLANGGEADELETMIPLNVETARIAYERLGHARNLLRRIETAIYAFAGETPIPLSNGMVLGKRSKLGNEQLDGDVVYEVVRAKHGQGIADAAVSREATKTKLRAALGFVGAASVAAAEREILDEVRARGGAKRVEKEVVDEHRPQPRLSDKAAS